MEQSNMVPPQKTKIDVELIPHKPKIRVEIRNLEVKAKTPLFLRIGKHVSPQKEGAKGEPGFPLRIGKHVSPQKDGGPWSHLLEQNRYDKEVLKKLMNRQIDRKDFKSQLSERMKGQWNWSMESYNIRASKYACKNKCVYCYIGPMFARWGRPCEVLDIEDMMPVDVKKVNHSWTHVQENQRKVIFFPSSSDIFEENAVDYVNVCRKIIKAGHDVFFVTKPTMKSITAIVKEFEKDDLVDRFPHMCVFVTITTNNDTILRQYEPCASLYRERVEAIIYLIQHGFYVNVMMEPYLSDPIAVIDELMPILRQQKRTDWVIPIGKMNYTSTMKLNPDPEEDRRMKEYLDDLYTPKNLLALWQYIEPNPHLFFKKDTVMALHRLM